MNLDLSNKSTFISCDTTLDSVIDGDTCDDPRVWKNLQHPWIWYKLYELIIMFLFIYSQKYSQSLTGESQDHKLMLVLKIY